ncbi:MAG: hypothetical protein U1E65_26875 [Myxococcota bacterium]
MRLALLAATCLALSSAPSWAATSDEQLALGIGVSVVSLSGSLVTGVAAIIYARKGLAFDTPWAVAALISSAFSISAAITAATQLDNGGAGLGVALGAVAAWPLGYTIRSALSEAEPGQPFTPAPKADLGRTTVDFQRPALPGGVPIFAIEL